MSLLQVVSLFWLGRLCYHWSRRLSPARCLNRCVGHPSDGCMNRNYNGNSVRRLRCVSIYGTDIAGVLGCRSAHIWSIVL
jgi:hypothetical protein